MSEICYSPYPPQNYSVSGGGYHAGYGARSVVTGDLAVWNLLWLSDPTIDNLLLWSPEAVLYAPLDSPMLRACLETAGQSFGSHAVRQAVTQMLPSRFCALILTTPKLAKPLALYRLLGARWFRCIEDRALAYRGVLESNGKVVQVNFSRPVTRLFEEVKLKAEVVEI